MRKNNLTNEIAGTNSKNNCESLEKLVKDPNVLCATLDQDKHKDFGSKTMWSGHLNLRWWMMLEVLKHGNNVLWTDTDVVFTRSPRASLEALAAAGVDAATNRHTMGPKFELNTGIGFLRHTNQTISLVSDTWDRVVNETTKMENNDPTAHAFEQQLFTDAVESKLGDAWSIRLTWDQNQNRDCALDTGLSRSGKADAGCHFDPKATGRMKELFATREPVSYNGFTFQVVPDEIFGWKETLHSIYKEHRTKGTRPTLEELPSVVHVKAGTGGKANDKVRYLESLGLWELDDTTINDTPPGILVAANVSSKVSLDDQVDTIMAQCARVKPLGEVVVLPPVDCETPLSFTVYNWPDFTNFTCYHFDAYKQLGGHQLYEACHHNLLAPFEVPYYTPSNTSSKSFSVSALTSSSSGGTEEQTSIPIMASDTSSEKVVPSMAVTRIVAPSASMAVDVSSSDAVSNTTVPSKAAIVDGAPKVLMAPLTQNASPNTSKVGLVIGHCNHKLEWLAGKEFTCQQYDVVIYQRCGQVTSVPSNVQNCTSVLVVPNKGQDSIVLYEHLAMHYDDGGLHRIVAYIPGEPDCGAHSTCDAMRPLTECTCLETLQKSLQTLLATPNVSYEPLNGHVISVRSTSWVAMCDEVGNFTGVATHTDECNAGSLSWINSMRSMIAVSRAQILRRPKAVYERMVVQLDSQ
eukprot:gene20307-24316_t